MGKLYNALESIGFRANSVTLSNKKNLLIFLNGALEFKR